MNNDTIYMGNSWKKEDNSVLLIGSKCKACNSTFFPERKRCTTCLESDNMKQMSISNGGKLYSYTIVRAAPNQFNPPYVVGYVDFPENIRVFGQIDITEEDYKQLKIGLEINLTSGVIREDVNDSNEENKVISYKFKANM